jgi:hypothetical protein
VSSNGTWDKWFSGRKWRVAEEVTGTTKLRGIAVTFRRGVFDVAATGGRDNQGGAFRSPLSTNLGRHGILLQETNADGSRDIPGSRAAFGDAAVKRARAEYGAIW